MEKINTTNGENIAKSPPREQKRDSSREPLIGDASAESEVPKRLLPSEMPDIEQAGLTQLLHEQLKWLQPVLFGCKPMTMMNSNDLPGFLDIANKIVRQVNQQGQIEVLFQDIKSQNLLGRELDSFDWSLLHSLRQHGLFWEQCL